MAKMIMCWLNQISVPGVTVSSFGALGNMPVQNLTDPRPGKRWRAASLTDWGQFDIGANTSSDVFILRYPRDVAMPGGTVRHTFDASGGTAGTGAVADSGVIPLGLVDGYGYHVWQPDDPINWRYWRFTYNASGVSALDTGVAYAGLGWTPEFNISADNFSDQWTDLSVGQQGNKSGSQFWDERPRQRKIAFGLDAISVSEKETVREMQRISGISRPVMVIVDPDDAPRETIIGTMKQVSPLVYRKALRYSKVFEIEESL